MSHVVGTEAESPPRSLLSRLTGGAPALPLIVLFGLNAADWMDRVAFNVLLPNIRDDFGLSLAGVLALVTAITPLSLLAGIGIAYYADRKPRIRIAVIGATLWSVFSLATAWVTNIAQLGIARVGSGLAKATNDPTHNSLLADWYPVNVRPAVYATHQAAQNFGNFAGPLTAGFLALYFGWRLPFLLFPIPTMFFVVLALRLKEPARGVQDRLAMGASAEDAALEETPPSFGEAWRMLYSIRSLKRIFMALPFVGVSSFGLLSLLNLFYADVYGLNSAQRGAVTSTAEVAAIVGLLIGTPIAQRLMNRDPALVLRFLGVVAVGIAGSVALLAASPNLGVAIAANLMLSSINAVLTPSLFAIFSVVIPARTRSLGFTSGALWLLPGLVLLPIIGGIGDRYGLRTGIAVLIPLYLIGFMIYASAGRFLADDIETARVSSMAEHEARRALEEGEPKLLMVRGLEVAYDGVQVLFGVDFDLHPGEIVALLGTNGAGKSTLLSAVSGLVDPIGGAIYYDGMEITHLDARHTAKLGLIQMPGGRSVFPTLTVAEHFKLAPWLVTDDAEHVAAATEDVLALFPRLRERWDQMAGSLSGGEQQMLGLSMALIAKPKLLMIDELSLGLAPAIVEALIDVVGRIHAQGTSIVLVEQSVNVALTIASRAYFLEKGEVRFSGPTAELLERDDILRAVFLQGTSAANGEPPRRRAHAAIASAAEVKPPLLEVSGLSKHFGGIQAVDNVGFTVGQHEIVGLIGPNGAGKTTIFDLISGFLTADDGSIVFQGEDVTRWSPDARARAGLGRSFQDARLVTSCTVAENIALALERHLEVRDHLAMGLALPHVRAQERNVAWTVADLIEVTGLGAFRNKFAGELSTGSRRIVDLAMAIAHDPTLLILDEPSSGIAQREAEALGPLLERIQAETECGLLLIEHDIQLITSVSDRMLALEVGAVIAEGTPDEVTTNPRVVSSYLGTNEAAINRSMLRPKGGPRRQAKAPR